MYRNKAEERVLLAEKIFQKRSGKAREGTQRKGGERSIERDNSQDSGRTGGPDRRVLCAVS